MPWEASSVCACGLPSLDQHTRWLYLNHVWACGDCGRRWLVTTFGWAPVDALPVPSVITT